MTDLRDRTARPTLEEIAAYVQNLVFQDFSTELMERYGCREAIEYSACSMEPGWNVKFKKSGRSLCTIYPRETYFTVMAVVGRREKEAMLPDCAPRLREIYARTAEGNGQRWLMIDLEDRDEVYRDVLRLIEIRRNR